MFLEKSNCNKFSDNYTQFKTVKKKRAEALFYAVAYFDVSSVL